MFPTDFFCFRDSVLPPRSLTVLILRPNMILASSFLGLILATSQLFVPGVEGDRVSDAIDSGEAFYNFFIICDPDLYYKAELCY